MMKGLLISILDSSLFRLQRFMLAAQCWESLQWRNVKQQMIDIGKF